MFKTKINIPIYFGYLIVVFSEDVKAVSDRYKLGLEEYKPAYVQQNKDKAGVTQYWIVFDTKHIDHGTIAHEVTHCANWIFYDRGIKMDFLNDEPYAYLVDWITDEVYRCVKKYGVVF